MPYNCEECEKEGARMHSVIGKRLCPECTQSDKYKTICKSDAIRKYRLKKRDIDNYPYQEFECVNPMYRTASPMILYYERDVKQYFINIHTDILHNELNIENEEIDYQIESVLEYLREKRDNRTEDKYNKIHKKLKVELEDLPGSIKNELSRAKNGTEYEKIISNYLRKNELYTYLKQNDLEEYIELEICKNYITGAKKCKLIEIKTLIEFMLRKKQQIKEAIKNHNLPKKRYLYIYHGFINSETDDDIQKIINLIKDKEERYNILTTKLKENGLELRTDSSLCSTYLSGNDKYSVNYIIDTMKEMKWFHNNTNYTKYSIQYDNRFRQQRGYYYDYYNDYYDEDDDEDNKMSKKEKREKYNRKKSEYAKENALKEWIKQGKPGITPPETLKDQINYIEEEIQNEQNSSESEKQICQGQRCCNTASSKCLQIMCKRCCYDDKCEGHKNMKNILFINK
jgi:hypothetical protein